MQHINFTETVTSALVFALTTTVNGGAAANLEDLKNNPADLARVCRRAAHQLLFDLDGKTLLDLAMEKFSIESVQ